jgi:hypothetical protein
VEKAGGDAVLDPLRRKSKRQQLLPIQKAVLALGEPNGTGFE